jgi:hypothetical protein
MSADAYLKAVMEFEKQEKELERIATTTAMGSQGIRYGKIPGTWPSIEDITAAISTWNTLRIARDQAWNAVPPEMRSKLQAPAVRV